MLNEIAAEANWAMHLNGGTDTQAKQVCFHAIVGNFGKDLGVLANITNLKHWQTRHEHGSIFNRRMTEGKSVGFDAVRFVKYSNLSQASLVKNNLAQSQQVSTIPTFSGPQDRYFSDEFFEFMRQMEGQTKNQGSSISHLTTYYASLNDQMDKFLEANRHQKVGTTKWYFMEGATFDEDGPETVGNVEATGRIFLQGHIHPSFTGEN